ncbi:uncharacterized protein si:dkey-109l4.3 isoform X2 [Silurus meridionalis]|uniref:uncharacterized protein si:dkey-109l4.3 isoform X2 n=1 Tax=Silurus meridionalis TaxID=175797 RepID=UPI001EEC42E0|nr:uncharacterized protein si:dkey-109l4.3 isoform X2 [Silurus meridionalis]
MDLCGFHSSTNGHTHVPEWQHETSAGVLPLKRKRSDFPNVNGDRRECRDDFPAKETTRNHSVFVRIDGQRGVYFSESWEPNGSTLYLPVHGTVLANMQKYEQISFEQGCFCIGDETGGFLQRVQGKEVRLFTAGDTAKQTRSSSSPCPTSSQTVTFFRRS